MSLGDARSGKLLDNLTALGRALRRAGLPVDSARMALAAQALLHTGLDSRREVHDALLATLVSTEADRAVFTELFNAIFRDPQVAQLLLSQMLPKAEAASKAPARSPRAQEALARPTSQQAQGRSRNEPEELRLDAAMTASERVRLRQADFQSLSASEYRLMQQLVQRLSLDMPQVPGRRLRPGLRGHRPDWARAMQDTLRLGGEWAALRHLQRQPQPLPLLILVDVSGSMERYARLLLAFLHASTRHLRRTAFAFGTVLTDLQPAFRLRDSDAMLAATNRLVHDFAGGTRLGASLATLRQQHARGLVGRRTVVLLISDGLDTGDLTQLDAELSWLGRHTRSLWWLNPLLRFDGYAPLAGGAQVLQRHAQAMLAVHNLSRLEELAHSLGDIVRQAQRRPLEAAGPTPLRSRDTQPTETQPTDTLMTRQ
jgi:uncharacterized protein with von Willebrand factor type A (vWA) domain